MAGPRSNNNDGGSVQDDVAANLGLSPEDLGMGGSDDEFAPADDLTDEGDEPAPAPRPSPDDGDETDVSHIDAVPRQVEGQQQKPFPKHAEVKPDSRGNLVDATGRVVAKAGREARYYQDAFKARNAFNQLNGQHQETSTRLNRAIEIGQKLVDEVEQYKQREATLKEFNVTPDEQLQAYQFVAMAKRDPIAAIKGVLTLAAARGIDLKELGMPGGAMDMKSITDLIRNEIGQVTKPITDQQRQQQETQQRNDQAAETQRKTNEEVQSFFARNPEARPYIDIFQKMYEDPSLQNMSLGEAWARLQLHLARQPRSNPQNTQRRRAIPNSRGFNNQPMTDNDGSDLGMAPVSTSFEDIVRSVLR